MKNQIFKVGEGFTKNQYIGGNCLKGGAWTVCRFKGVELGEKRGMVFVRVGVDTPMHTMNDFYIFAGSLQIL